MTGIIGFSTADTIWDFDGKSESVSGCLGFKLAGCVNWGGGLDVSLTFGAGHIAEVSFSDTIASITRVSELNPGVTKQIVEPTDDPISVIEIIEDIQQTDSPPPGWGWGNIGGHDEEELYY